MVLGLAQENSLYQSANYNFAFRNIPLSEYIDEFFTKGDTFSTCEENIHKTMRLYDNLGFAINVKRSQIIPTQRIESQGLWLICDWKWSLHLPKKKCKN